jgi:murein DD-endopeptidase MepM/ murein hydrolase activator NlpD
LKTVSVAAGQQVTRGEELGTSGSGIDVYSRDWVPHLHFEVRVRGGANPLAVDPFRDTSYTTHKDWPLANGVSLWTVDNNPQYSGGHPCDEGEW